MPTLELADGRTLEYAIDGPADGTPLILHHGTPSAALLFGPDVATATKHGLRAVMTSRAGYAGSTANPGRTVADVTADTAALLDELGAETFYTIGWSGGGPHALACAALLPGRCLGAGTIAGVAPFAAAGLDWLAGMGPENVAEFGAAVAGIEPLTEYLEAEAAGLAQVTGDQIAEALGGLVSEVDKAALTGEFADYMAVTARLSVGTGIAGWRDDDLAFVRDWGFDLASISTPLSIWQGAQDRMVPFAHGQWFGEHVPQARLHLDQNEGHLSLAVGAFDRVVAELVGG